MPEKFKRCEIWAMFISAGPFVMSRTHAQNGLYIIFKARRFNKSIAFQGESFLLLNRQPRPRLRTFVSKGLSCIPGQRKPNA